MPECSTPPEWSPPGQAVAAAAPAAERTETEVGEHRLRGTLPWQWK